MAWVSKFVFGLLCVHAIRAGNQHQAYAILMRRPQPQESAPVLERVGRHPAALPGWSTHTAIVNAVQAQAHAGGNLSNAIVFCTYLPTSACIGIMKAHGLHSVTYVHNNTIVYRPLAPANVVNIVAQPAPPTQNPNRNWVPVNVAAALAADPSMNNDQDAVQYIQGLAQLPNAPAQLAGWQATWNLAAVQAGQRFIHPLHQELVGAAEAAGQAYADTMFMLLAYALAGAAPAIVETRGARVVAVLGAPTGEIYGWQYNMRGFDTTFHAETNLIQALRAPVPAGATLYSTLEPCYQCAGMFHRAQGMRCVFGQNDPNMTNNTVIANMAHRFNAATFRPAGSGGFMSAAERLDTIKTYSTAAAQAAAVARARLPADGMPGPPNSIAAATAATNLAAYQKRVLDILNLPPSLEVFRHARQLLGNMIQIAPLVFPLNAPQLRLAQNVANVIGRFP